MQSLTPSRIALVAWLWVAGAPLVTAAAPAPGAPAEGEAELDPVRPEAAGLFVEFGRGATFKSPGGDFALTLRGRVQTRADLDGGSVDAKYGAGDGWRYYCAHDLLQACEVHREQEGEPIMIFYM